MNQTVMQEHIKHTPILKQVVVLGGGLAGLALATELAGIFSEVILLEKKTHLGGRASNTFDRKTHDPVPIGPHIFVTAYNNFRRFLRKIQAEHAVTWEKKVLLEVVHQGVHHQFRHSRMRHPFYMAPWLLRYPFLSFADKLSNLRFGWELIISPALKFEALDDINAVEYLSRKRVSKRSIDLFWRFLVMSMLNVPIERCSAAEFCLLFKHWSQFEHRKIGFAKKGLGDIYTEHAREHIESRGGSVKYGNLVRQLRVRDGKIHIITERGGTKETFIPDICVSTLNPVELSTVLEPDILKIPFFEPIQAFEGVPYISVNLWFDDKITHKQFWALVNAPGITHYLNTDFYDQSNIYETRKHKSFITSNIIYSKKEEQMTDGDIISKTLAELREVFPRMTAQLTHSHVHRIPYVVYAPYPGMRRHKRPHITPIENLYLAGDWTAPETQCMEAAVRSGYRCAEHILRAHGIEKKICDERTI